MILGCSKQYSTRETFQSKSLRRGMNSELGDTFTPMRSMSFLGLFLFKDVIALGASLYSISYFGHKAILYENKC
jgi:hypothetical protein